MITVEANHRRYTDYHERILKAVDTCLPVEKLCSIDEMACRLMGTERQPAAARLALKVKRALREQVGECLTCLDERANKWIARAAASRRPAQVRQRRRSNALPKAGRPPRVSVFSERMTVMRSHRSCYDPPLGGPPQALGNSRQGTCRCIGAHKSRREIAERLPLCDKSSV